MINAAKMYLMDIYPTVGTPRSTGFLTAQVGNTAGGSFDNGALAAPSASIMSLWGAAGPDEPISVMALGRLSDGNATAGTLDAVLDTSNHDTDTAGVAYTAQSYAVEQQRPRHAVAELSGRDAQLRVLSRRHRQRLRGRTRQPRRQRRAARSAVHAGRRRLSRHPGRHFCRRHAVRSDARSDHPGADDLARASACSRAPSPAACLRSTPRPDAASARCRRAARCASSSGLPTYRRRHVRD